MKRAAATALTLRMAMSSHVPLKPNGDGATITMLTPEAWQNQLHLLYPNATRIGLWTADGEEIAYTARCSDANPACADWAKQGECTQNRGYMHAECKLSCGVCPPATKGGALPDDSSRPVYAVLDHYPFVWPSIRLHIYNKHNPT